MKLSRRVIFTLHILVIVLVPLTVAFGYNILDQRAKLETATLGHLRTVANIQEARVEQVVEQNLERLALVASRTQMRISLNEYNQTGNEEALQKVGKIIGDAKTAIDDFKVLSIASEDGEIIVSTKPDEVGKNVSDMECFITARNSNYINTELIDGEEHFILGAPLKLDDQYIGSLMIEVDMETLTAIARHHIALGRTGEILIGREVKGGDARLIVQPRFHEHEDARTVISKNEEDVPIIQALAKNETLLASARDYRGKEVLAVTRYIPDAHWGVVVKIDKEEAFEVTNLLQLSEIGMFGATIALILIALGVYSRSIEPPRRRR